jgi:hypothetical protein
MGDAAVEQRVRKEVAELAARFPIYEKRVAGADGAPYRVQTKSSPA